MDINNYYDEVPVPSLDSSTYAADMQDMVDKINENFRRLGSAAWLKGDRGASAESNEELLFDENENTTDLGRAVFATIYKDYGIEDVQDSNLNTYSSIRNFVSGIEGTATTSFDNITTDSTVTVLGIYEPGEDIEYTLEEGWFAGPWFFNDSRCDVLDQMTDAELQRFSDMSCVLYGSYDGENWSIDSYYIMPTFYWNSDSNMFCWKIDGRTTNVTAQGVKGEKGDNANSYVFLGGDIDYSPNPTELNVTLNNVWWKGDDETWGWKSVNSLTDDEKAALTGCLGLVWFRRAYVEPTNDEEHYTPTFTMGIIQNAENMYIEYNEGGGTDIQFDFAQIMSIMSLKNSLSNITAGRAIPQTNDVLRGLFLPIEYTDNTGTPHIEQTNKYHEMWSTLDGTGDLNIGVVTDVDNPEFNTEDPTEANINVYYKNFKTDTSKTRIEAGDVTTGSADAGEIDLCAENDVDIIAGNMVDIDTPKVEMGNDDNKSNAVVHGKLNITGSEKDEDKITITHQYGDEQSSNLSFAVIVRPIDINITNEVNQSGNITYYTLTSFEFIFGYCGYRSTLMSAGGASFTDMYTMPVLFNAQRLENQYWCTNTSGTYYQYTTINGKDVKITYEPNMVTLYSTIVPGDYNDYIYIPNITIEYDGYITHFNYNEFILSQTQQSRFTLNNIQLLDLSSRQGFSNPEHKYRTLTKGSSIYGSKPLLQFFRKGTDNNIEYLETSITSKYIESLGENKIYDNNINGYSFVYDYRYGKDFNIFFSTVIGQSDPYYFIIHKEDVNNWVNITRWYNNEFQILVTEGTGTSWKNSTASPIISQDRYSSININILPKGMVGYIDNDYIYNPRFTNSKLYNGNMFCNYYNLHPSSAYQLYSGMAVITPNLRPERITTFTIPENNDNNENNEEHNSDIEVEGSEYNG